MFDLGDLHHCVCARLLLLAEIGNVAECIRVSDQGQLWTRGVRFLQALKYEGHCLGPLPS